MKAQTIAIYVRVSSAEQAADGVSLDAQEAELRTWAAAHHPGLSAVVFREEGKSAYSGKRRPRYEEMVGAVERGEVALITATRPDRLHRSVMEGIRLRQLCAAHDTRIHTLSAGPVDTSAFGNFNANMLAAVAELESGIKSERVTDAFEYLRSTGTFVGRRPPWGYIRPQGSRRIVPSADQRLVRRVFELYGDEARSLSQIRDWLRSEPREERSDASITVQSLSKLIGNPVYAGYVVANTKSAETTQLPGNHEPLCPPDLWVRVQERREKNRQTGYRGSKYLPFGKLARCANCFGPLRWKKTNDDQYFYVVCNASCDESRAMPAQYFEAGVAVYIDTTIQYLDRALADGSWRDFATDAGELERATVRLAEARGARESIRRSMLDGLLSADEAKEDLRISKGRLEQAEADYARVNRSADELHHDLSWLRDTLLNGDQTFCAWWTRAAHPDRIATLEQALEGVWLGDVGLAFKFRRGLDFPFVVPYTRSRFTREISDQLTQIGFPPRVAEPVGRLRSPRRARSGGRSPSPPCAALPVRDLQ